MVVPVNSELVNNHVSNQSMLHRIVYPYYPPRTDCYLLGHDFEFDLARKFCSRSAAGHLTVVTSSPTGNQLLYYMVSNTFGSHTMHIVAAGHCDIGSFRCDGRGKPPPLTTHKSTALRMQNAPTELRTMNGQPLLTSWHSGSWLGKTSKNLKVLLSFIFIELLIFRRSF